MYRFVLASCVLLAAGQHAVAEDAQSVTPTAPKASDIRLHDLVKVLVDDCPAEAGGAVAAQKKAPYRREVLACIVGIEPNGILRIEGQNETLAGDEIWERSVSGKVRRESLQADHSVRSEDVADFRYKVLKKPMPPDAVASDVVFPHPVLQVAAQATEFPKASAQLQACPHCDGPYQPTPVGLKTSPNAARVAALHDKEAELARLQQEVLQLRAQTGTPQQIVVRTQILEVSLTKMEKLGIEAPFMSSGYTKMSSESAAKQLCKLCKDHAAKVLAEPTVVAVDGRPASYHVGGEIPVPNLLASKQPVEFRPVGTEVDIVPQSLGDNRVRMELKVRVSEVDQSNTVAINGTRMPTIHAREISTRIESEFGETTVLSGMVDTRTERIKVGDKVTDVENRIATIFVVSPELVESLPTAQNPAAQVTPR